MKKYLAVAGVLALFGGTAAAKDTSGKAGSFVTGKGKCEFRTCATGTAEGWAGVGPQGAAKRAAGRFKAKEGATLLKSKTSAGKSIEGVPTSTTGIKPKPSAFSTNTHRFDPYKNLKGVWTDMRPLSAKKATKSGRPSKGVSRIANSKPVIVGAPSGVKKRSGTRSAK